MKRTDLMIKTLSFGLYGCIKLSDKEGDKDSLGTTAKMLSIKYIMLE